MSDARDPPRLRAPGSGASPETRALLEVLRADRPDAAQLARLARRLPTGGGPPAAPAATSLIPSAMLGASLALLVLGGAWLGQASSPPAAAPTSPAVSAPATSTPLSATAAAAPVPAPIEPRPIAVPAAPRASAPPPATAPSVEAGAAAAAPEAAPHGGGDLPAATGGAETEVELVQRAQHVLPRDPAQALAAAEEHRRRFTGGALAQEREVIAMAALVALGRRDEARARAERFLESYPRSAHRPGVEALLPGLPAGGSDHKSDAGGGPTL